MGTLLLLLPHSYAAVASLPLLQVLYRPTFRSIYLSIYSVIYI